MRLAGIAWLLLGAYTARRHTLALPEAQQILSAHLTQDWS